MRIEDHAKLKCLQFCKNFRKIFEVHHQKWGRLTTRSLRCRSLEKCNNTKPKGVQFQDEDAPLTSRNLHHEDVASMSNLRMTLKAIIHSLV